MTNKFQKFSAAV